MTTATAAVAIPLAKVKKPRAGFALQDLIQDPKALARLHEQREKLMAEIHERAMAVQAIHEAMADCFAVPAGTIMPVQNSGKTLKSTGKPFFFYDIFAAPAIGVVGTQVLPSDGMHKVSKHVVTSSVRLAELFSPVACRHAGA